MNINAEEEINKRAQNMTRDDIADVLGREEEAKRLADKAGFIKQYWEDIKTTFALVRDWIGGSDKTGPTTTICSLVGALVYFLSPIDLVPDWLPLAGFLDDAAVLAFAFRISAADLVAYRQWRRAAQSTSDAAKGDATEED